MKTYRRSAFRNDDLEDLLKKIFQHYWKLVIFAGVIIGLDQYTKFLIIKNIPLGEMIYPIPAFSSFFRFIHWYNTGVAFGMFQGMNEVFKVLAILVALVIIYFYPRIPDHEWPLKVAMAMQFAGALGNLIDRFVVGYVVDFVSVGTFPVFNVADASITMGVVVLVIGMWIQERHEKQNEEKGTDTPEENPNLMPIADQESGS
jgi:signal peptidase II